MNLRGRSTLIAFIVVITGAATGSSARTWHVLADGSGDAPTLAAAIDSSASGDVIAVAAGTYLVDRDGLSLKAGTSLISDEGPATTFLRPADPVAQPGLVEAQSGCVVSGFNMKCAAAGVNAISFLGDGVEISHNIIDGGTDDAVFIYGTGINIHNNVCFAGRYSIDLAKVTTGYINNNIILDGINGLYPLATYCNLINGSAVDGTGLSGDPMFCGTDNYYLQSDSPCAPGNVYGGIDCGLIGALPVGCGVVSVESKTWGAVKAMYRNP